MTRTNFFAGRHGRLFDLMRQDLLSQSIAERINHITMHPTLSDQEMGLLRSTVVSSLHQPAGVPR